MVTSVKFRRIGALLIDLSISSMFFRIILSLSIIQNLRLTYNLVIDLLLVMGFLVLYILVYMLYIAICIKLLGKTIGKYLLSLSVIISRKKMPNTKQLIIREWYKIVLLTSSLIIGYILYAIIFYLILNKSLYHEYHPIKTRVI